MKTKSLALLLILNGFALILVFAVYFYQTVDQSKYKWPEKFSDYQSQFRYSDFYLYAEDGSLINQLRQNFNKRNIVWTSIAEVDPDFLFRLIQQEDKRFYFHPGVDIFALTRALIDLTSDEKKSGASTLTMQLAKKILKLNTKTPLGKLKQIYAAIKLDAVWTKNEILEAYLNTIYFQGEIQGIGTATTFILGKSPNYLSYEEQSVLLKMIKNPNLNYSLLSNEQFHIKNNQQLAYHYHHFLIKQKNQSTIKSDINYELQKFADSTLKQHISALLSKNVHDGSVIVIDNYKKSVIAYVANSGPDLSQNPYVDMIQSYRQLGSTLKPFLYGLAFDKNILDLDSWLQDSPVNIVFPNGTYAPKNHDGIYYGWVHPAQALSSSLNIPAVKTIQLTGVDSFVNNLKIFGFSLNQLPDDYGPSLALGVLDGRLWDLAWAYHKLSTKSVFSKTTHNKLNWILSSPQNRSLTFGQDSILYVPQGFAVKTGTSKDMKDNWCVGYNDAYTIAVWVGNADSTPMQNVLGVTGAAPVWRSIVDYILQKNPTKITSFTDPEDEKSFIQLINNSPSVTYTKTNKIINPLSDSIYAVDPSIPNNQQKIILQADGDQNNLKWKYRNEFLKKPFFDLKKGRHIIELYKNSQKVDQVKILVK